MTAALNPIKTAKAPFLPLIVLFVVFAFLSVVFLSARLQTIHKYTKYMSVSTTLSAVCAAVKPFLASKAFHQ
jgi:hypothetical protein